MFTSAPRSQCKLRFWNQNYFGSHFGGSMFAMTDPFFAFLLKMKLGTSYAVWDKASTIRFRKPGLGVLHAEFVVPPQLVEDVRHTVETSVAKKAEPELTVDVVDETGEVVAQVVKTLSVRKLDPSKSRRRSHLQV
jgi:hypothetical protein